MLPKILTDRQLLNLALFISTNDYQYFDIRITKAKIQMQKQMLCVTYKNQELSKLPENSISLNMRTPKLAPRNGNKSILASSEAPLEERH